MTADDKTNTTGRSVHQSVKTLEDAVGTFLADFKNYAQGQKESPYGNTRLANDMHSMLGKLRAAYNAHRGEAKEIPRSPYERKVQQRTGGDGNEIEETHESYGLVQINRSSGGGRMFGSSVEHQNVFSLRILRGARLVRSTGEDFRADGRVPIVDVQLTPAQFVEMITTMNSGDGIPCTLNYVEGVKMDPTPDDAGSELRAMVDLFKDRVADVMAEMHKKDAAVDALLEQKTFTKADKAALRATIHSAVRLLDESAPFILKVFGENVEKAAAKGKLEVEAFIATALHRVGIKAIRDAGGTLLLGEGEDKK